MQSGAASMSSAISSKTADNVSPFPFLDLKAQFASIREETLAAVQRVLESQQLILGPEVAAFEKEIAEILGSLHAISCASGSDALLLALMAYGIGPGDEVITTPFTFVATAGSIARLGARPVFVDIDPLTYNMDAKQIESAITPRTRGIIPVHLFGLSADMDEISAIASRQDLTVIEDAAQAIGARYRAKSVGTIGHVGCFSFFPSKNLGGAGDGGMLVTQDSALADRLKILRVHGSREKYSYELLGMNSRLDALQAAILRVKVKHLEKWADKRRRNADCYRSLFEEFGIRDAVSVPEAPAHCDHVYNQFVIRTNRRDELRDSLRRAGIPTEVYYPSPLHLQPAFAHLGHAPGDFPNTEAACREVLALPIYPELSERQQRFIVEQIASSLRASDERSRSARAND